MKKTVTLPKYSFSYCRFSSENQRGNSSIDRQSPLAEKLSKEKGWILREDWNVLQEAVSAYKKDNFPKLKAIIQLAESGQIPSGTVMIIEAVDRLSRALVDEGREMMRDILLSGIEICDNEGNHFTKLDLNDPLKLMVMILKLASANEYSARISMRVKAAMVKRQTQVANGETLLLNCDRVARKDVPPWITNNGKTFELNETGKTVKLIFSLYLQGIGPSAIARKFNTDGIPTFKGERKGKKCFWGQGTIYRLLSDRRMLGEYLNGTETVKGYYPAVIEEEVFMKVQAKLDDNRGKRPTTTGKVRNLFSGVGFCTCGEKVQVTGGHGGTYINCWGRVKSTGCKVTMVQYNKVESAFKNLLRLDPSKLVRDEQGNSQSVQIQVLKGRLSENEKQISNITEALTIAVTKSLVLRQSELEQQSEEIKRQIELESAKVVSNKGSSKKLKDIVDRIENLSSDIEFRLMVQGWIRENINRIVFNNAEKTFTVNLKTGNLVTMGLDGDVKGCKSFVSLFTNQPIKDQEVIKVNVG